LLFYSRFKGAIMFKLSSRSRRAKRGLKVPKGVHILQDHELERSIGGGTPVQQFLLPGVVPDWMRNTMNGVSEAGYSRYTQMFPGASLSPDTSWAVAEDAQPIIKSFYYGS
jgi:hypothetical protein